MLNFFLVANVSRDLYNFLNYYNHRSIRQGYKLKENGYNISGRVYLSKNFKNDLTNEIGSDKIKLILLRDRKEME